MHRRVCICIVILNKEIYADKINIAAVRLGIIKIEMSARTFINAYIDDHAFQKLMFSSGQQLEITLKFNAESEKHNSQLLDYLSRGFCVCIPLPNVKNTFKSILDSTNWITECLTPCVSGWNPLHTTHCQVWSPCMASPGFIVLVKGSGLDYIWYRTCGTEIAIIAKNFKTADSLDFGQFQSIRYTYYHYNAIWYDEE